METKKLFLVGLASLCMMSTAVAEIHPQKRYVEVGVDLSLAAMQNAYTITDIMVKDLVIDLTKLIADKMGIQDPTIKFEGYRESDPERRLLSTEKIRTRTDWEPIIDLDKGLDECVENYTKGE